ncbi:hypothetical protein IJG12_00145 [Candidatus Saccharibacteria bacterium]|nr:hypothetical protein [Candidatus Saccharibacteria bacterium]
MRRFLVVFAILVVSLMTLPVSAIAKNQEEAISDHCESIRNSLKTIQKNDAKARVHLGGRYETILSRFLVPLNVRLVENNLPSADLVENQNDFADTKVVFTNDYIEYQQNLEELVAMDCKNQPAEFYEKLVKVRQKRKTMEQDVMKMRTLITKQINAVNNLMSKVK